MSNAYTLTDVVMTQSHGTKSSMPGTAEDGRLLIARVPDSSSELWCGTGNGVELLSGAKTDLSNLSQTGEDHFIRVLSQVRDCIFKAPNGLPFVTSNTNTINLPIGTVLLCANGVDANNAVTNVKATTTNALSVSVNWTKSNDGVVFFNKTSNSLIYYPISAYTRDTVEPTGLTNMIWFNPNNNKYKVTSNSGATWSDIVAAEIGSFTTISDGSIGSFTPRHPLVVATMDDIKEQNRIVRNIGEIVASPIELTDAELHLLDGDVILGNGSYSDFVDYIKDLYEKNPTANWFSQSETITRYNYSSFGGLLENDGVLYNFLGNTNYAIASSVTPTASMELVIKCNQSTLVANSDILEASSNGHGIILRNANASTGQINCYIGSIAGSWVLSNFNTGLTIAADTWMYFKITWDGTTYKFYSSIDGEAWTEGNSQNNSNAPDLSSSLYLGGCNWQSYSFANGQIDLNESYLKVDGNTVWEGRTDTTYTAEENWWRLVNTYGVCGKFVYDSVNNTVRLPKYSSKIYTGGGTAPVIGNGVAIGLTDSTSKVGLLGATSTAGTISYLGGNTSSYNTDVGTTITYSAGSSTYKSLGLTTEGTKSGLVADIANITTSLDGYYYIVIATLTKTQVQVNIDNIVTDLNGKVDKANMSEVQCVVETYRNGASWYRVWSDGWCEQGGYGTAPTRTYYTVWLLKPYKDNGYGLFKSNDTGGAAEGSDTGQNMLFDSTMQKNVNSFRVYMSPSYSSTSSYYWYACGYIR